MATRHYKYGGSTIERIELCSMSVHEIAKLGELPAGPAAARGTQLHDLTEKFWNSIYINKKPFKVPENVSQLDADIAKAACEALYQAAAAHGFAPEEINIEKQYQLRETHPD